MRVLMTQRPESFEQHFALGQRRLASGDLPAAADSFRAAITLNPNFADAFNNLGVTFDRMGLTPNAIRCFEHARALRPDLARVHRNLADVLRRSGRALDAVDALRDAVKLLAEDVDLRCELGETLLDAGQPEESVAVARTVVSQAPQNARAHAALGMALLVRSDLALAIESLERALALNPRLAYVAVNLGEALRHLNRPGAAAAAYRRALGINENLPEAYIGLGTTLEQLARVAEAVNVLKDAAARYPRDVRMHHSLGTLLHRLGHFAGAVACYQQVLSVDPQHLRALLDTGHALESLGRLSEAVASFRLGLAMESSCAEAIAGLASCGFRMCAWDEIESSLARLDAIPAGLDALHPFLLLAAGTSPTKQIQAFQRRATRFSTDSRELPLRRSPRGRLKVAYISPDFREHPVAHALAAVIERHDRDRVQPIGVALSATDGSVVGARVRAAFDLMIDAAALSDHEVVTQLRQHEIDIAVDLAGFTVGARTGIFAGRCAPVQVNYLGFPASMGTPFFDYIIADEVVLPPRDERFYAERVLRLPHCYLPVDCGRAIAVPRPNRVDVGLPPQGFVFCAFNNSYKITRVMFQVWLSLLADVPGSVLWLRTMNRDASDNLTRAAVARGISNDRLIFAPHVERMDQHLARLQLADLFLDTLPYNAHTTAADALWAGVPVITCAGDSFAGRVGASLLASAGLGDLICTGLEDYQRRALQLATVPHELNSARARLSAARTVAAAFDTQLYVRNLEALYATMQAH
jgi:protein O-GlcNAc transferase